MIIAKLTSQLVFKLFILGLRGSLDYKLLAYEVEHLLSILLYFFLIFESKG
jgi:hypothetical protein